MREISDLNVKQIHIFATDRIPFAPLRTPVGQKALVELFSWGEIGANPAVGELIFKAGAFQPKEGPPIIVNNLQISDRRIVLDVAAETEKATLVYSALAETLARFDVSRRWTDAAPIVLVHETNCVVTMEFEWSSLLSSPILQFAQVLNSRFSSDTADASIAGVKCGIVFSFAVKHASIQAHGITLTNKVFAIEPRVSTPLSEKRYRTCSPVDSSTHLALLRDFEALVMGRLRRKKGTPESLK